MQGGEIVEKEEMRVEMVFVSQNLGSRRIGNLPFLELWRIAVELSRTVRSIKKIAAVDKPECCALQTDARVISDFSRSRRSIYVYYAHYFTLGAYTNHLEPVAL
jgi:hypothetical protein